MMLSKVHRIPPYIICTDATLQDMVRRKPQTREGMMSISGMGAVKVSKYGDAFLKVIKAYVIQEKRMRQQVAAIAREAQRAALREKPRSTVAKKASVRQVEAPKPVQPSRPPLENDDADLADAYLSGMSIQQMADELGISAVEIRQRLADMDLIF